MARNWNPYHRAHENRVGVRHPAIKNVRKRFMKGVFLNFLILQALFLGLFAYIFGALYTQQPRTHGIHVLFVDYDGGVIGQSVRNAYRNLTSKRFPTLVERSPDEFAAAPGGLRNQVCETHYWAALWVSAGASERLAAALGGGAAAANYNRTDVMTYVWDEARYPTFVDSVSADVQMISNVARIAYSTTNGTGAVQSLNRSDPLAIEAFANPWILEAINIQPTAQGSRAIYNTLVIILIIIQEFFYIGTMNALYGAFHIYERLYVHRIIYFRLGVSAAYCFIGALCVTGMVWAFKAGWDVNGNQFVLMWMVLWLFAHINFLVLDGFTVWAPPQFAPMLLISWTVMNVASILLPFDISNGFYKWGYALPAHEAFAVMIDIWSRGCNPVLDVALPVLFAWEVLGVLVAIAGVYRRCHFAVIAAEQHEAEFKAQLAEAMAFEKGRDQQKLAEGKEQRTGLPPGVEPSESQEEKDAEVAEDTERMSQELHRLETMASQLRRSQKSREQFGPSFGFQFAKNKED